MTDHDERRWLNRGSRTHNTPSVLDAPPEWERFDLAEMQIDPICESRQMVPEQRLVVLNGSVSVLASGTRHSWVISNRSGDSTYGRRTSCNVQTAGGFEASYRDRMPSARGWARR